MHGPVAFSLLLLSLLLSWPGTCPAQQRAVRRDVQEAIVRLETRQAVAGQMQLYQQGTGFVVSPRGHVITSAHVIPRNTAPGAFELRVNRRGNQPVDLEAQLVGQPDADADAALLLVPGLGAVTPLCFADSERLEPGSRLVKYGFPRAGPIAPVTGTLSNRSGEVRADLQASSGRFWWGGGPPRRMWLLSLPLLPGDSGGPVLTEDGLIAGIACCGVPEDLHLAYMVPETAFVALRRRLEFSDGDCLRGHQQAANPSITQRIVGVWEGPYRCETGDGTIRMTITVAPSGRISVHEAFSRPPRSGQHAYLDVTESRTKPRTLEMRAARTFFAAEEYRLELSFDEQFRTARGVYVGHRTCRHMELQRKS